MLNPKGIIHMNRFKALALGASVALGTIGLSHADTAVTGSWKLTIGATDPCTVNLAADASDQGGTVTSDCDTGLNTIGRWKVLGGRLQLLSPDGQIVAYFQPRDDGYAGTRVTDEKKLVLSR